MKGTAKLAKLTQVQRWTEVYYDYATKTVSNDYTENCTHLGTLIRKCTKKEVEEFVKKALAM